MKRNILALLAVVVVIGLVSCGTSQSSQRNLADTHNSKNALDWAGVYKGMLPCADCEGIETTIQLNKDNTYKIKSEYLGKTQPSEEKNVFTESGKFTWTKDGSSVSLENGNKYQVGENQLIQLKRDGSKVTGALAKNYILGKLDGQIKETYWKLISLHGTPIKMDSSFNKEPHFILKNKDHRIFGNGGCNHLMGFYKLKEGHKLSFSGVASTLMACPNLKLEDQFKKVLEQTDHYSLMDDELTLLQGDTPLAKFKSVYF